MAIDLPKPKGASRPKQICRTPGCNRKASDTYCPEHDYMRSDKFKGIVREREGWYLLAVWRGNPLKPKGQRGGLAEAQLKREPLCRKCQKNGIITPATLCDHIIPWKHGKDEQEQWELFTDTDNHQSLCASCHNRKTNSDRRSERC